MDFLVEKSDLLKELNFVRSAAETRRSQGLHGHSRTDAHGRRSGDCFGGW
jgi:hypothetical protein